MPRTGSTVIPPVSNVSRGTGTGATSLGTGTTIPVPAPSFTGNLYDKNQGFNLNYFQPWLNSLQIPGLSPYPAAGNQLNSFFGNQFPFQLPNQMNQGANQFGPLLQQIMQQYGGFSGGFQPTMYGNLNYLNQYGLPGNRQVQQEQQNLGGMAGNLLGGNGQYGIVSLLQQIMGQGLPNQRSIEGLVGPQMGMGNQYMGEAGNLLSRMSQGQQMPLSPFQQQLQQTLSGMIQGGGLSPEFVAAQRRLVLDPARQDLMGNMNRMAGGQAQLTSPAFQELLRRQEGDFSDRLLSQGFQNLQGFLGQGINLGGQQFNQGLQTAGQFGSLGQQGIQNALQAFGIVPSSLAPYANLAGGLSGDLLNQSLQRFGTGGTLGLQNLQTIQNLANSPFEQALKLGQFGQQGQQNLLQTMLPSLLQFYQSQGQLGLGANQIPADILRTMIGGQYDLTRQQALIDAQNSAARWGALGNAIPGIAGILGQIFNRNKTTTPTGRTGTPTGTTIPGGGGGAGTGGNQLTYIPGVGLVWTGGGGGFGPWDGGGIDGGQFMNYGWGQNP